MSKMYKPPNKYDCTDVLVFLAGSIEMGAAELWQDKFYDRFKHLDITFLNPRRDDWDSSIPQSIDNDMFYGQVDWEHDGLLNSDVIVMYFDPNTKSPITLLELGLFASTGKIMVCCPHGFWRRGNVEYVCETYGLVLYDTFDELCNAFNKIGLK